MMARNRKIDKIYIASWSDGAKFLIGPMAVIVGAVESGDYDVSVLFYILVYVVMVGVWTVVFLFNSKKKEK